MRSGVLMLWIFWASMMLFAIGGSNTSYARQAGLRVRPGLSVRQGFAYFDIYHAALFARMAL